MEFETYTMVNIGH